MAQEGLGRTAGGSRSITPDQASEDHR
jgi:hypothetical protein